jgi:hypothetical protein
VICDKFVVFCEVEMDEIDLRLITQEEVLWGHFFNESQLAGSGRGWLREGWIMAFLFFEDH